MTADPLRTLLAATALAWMAGTHVQAAEPVACSPSLDAAAESMLEVLVEEQARIRASTLDSPVGVEETVQFDLAAHACHRGPGQSYRVFADRACYPPDDRGRVKVRYRYELFYRKALTLDAVFGKDWEKGTDGLHQVVFEPEGDGWFPVSRKDVLDLSSKSNPEGSGHPGMGTFPSGE